MVRLSYRLPSADKSQVVRNASSNVDEIGFPFLLLCPDLLVFYPHKMQRLTEKLGYGAAELYAAACSAGDCTKCRRFTGPDDRPPVYRGDRTLFRFASRRAQDKRSRGER